MTLTIEQEMQAAGLEILGPCEGLSRRRQVLLESALLEDFSAEEADVLGSYMLRVRAGPGQCLIAEGASSGWMMVLLQGTVDVAKRRVGANPASQDPADVARLAVLREGAVVGEMSMLDGEPRYAGCWALGDVEAAVLSRAAVGLLIQQHPAVGAKLLVKVTQLLAQRLRNTSTQLVKLLYGQKDPAARS